MTGEDLIRLWWREGVNFDMPDNEVRALAAVIDAELERVRVAERAKGLQVRVDEEPNNYRTIEVFREVDGQREVLHTHRCHRDDATEGSTI